MEALRLLAAVQCGTKILSGLLAIWLQLHQERKRPVHGLPPARQPPEA